MKKALIDFYLDYINDFLTTERMAEYYGITKTECSRLVIMGKKYHEQGVKEFKLKQTKNSNNEQTKLCYFTRYSF